MTRVLGIVILLLCFAWPTYAVDRYVSTTGFDTTGTGTQGNPWRTIQKAADNVNPGDTVFIRGGTYVEQVTFRRSGSAGNLITFVNFLNEFPIIDGSTFSVGSFGALVILTNVHHMVLRGVEIRGSSFWGLFVGGDSHHLQLDQLDVHNSADTNIFVQQNGSTPGFNRLTNSKVHDGNVGGIVMWSAPAGYWQIENNEVYGHAGNGNYDGVQIGGQAPQGVHHTVVRNNLIHDNGTCNCGADNLDLGGHNLNHHYLVELNTVYGVYGNVKMHSGDAVGSVYTVGVSGFHIMRLNRIIGIGYVTYDFPNPIVAYNNTLINTHQAFFVYSDDAGIPNRPTGDSSYGGGDGGRMNWKNNIFWQETSSTSHTILTAGGPVDVSYASIRLQNNLYKFQSGNQLTWGNHYPAPITAGVFNTYKNSLSPSFPDTGSVRTDATVAQTFTNYGTSDFHLVAGSPAIDGGTPLTRATNSGTNQTVIQVDRASYFYDGYCISGECVGTPDTIVIGSQAPVAIVSINDATNQITLANPRSWSPNDPVTLPYSGAAPDMGAYEFGSIVSLPPTPPVLMRVMPR